MPGRADVETAMNAEDVSNPYDSNDTETEALLPTSRPEASSPTKGKSETINGTWRQPKFSALGMTSAFVLGTAACLLAQLAICGTNCFKRYDQQQSKNDISVVGLPWAGSTEVQKFPPSKPTNAFPSLFPSNVGYAGATPTGAEAAVVATAPAYPQHTGQCSHVLLAPAELVGGKAAEEAEEAKKGSKFNLFRSWGNLSPWFSVDKGHFGVDSTASTPDTCRVTGLHFLHRHGARYPTAWASYGGPSRFGSKLHVAPETWNATGDLEFLNDWTYKLGEEVLTPFGRQQLYDLGISTRVKYGFLLANFTEKQVLPVFRTESQDRMLASAMNFAIGFFGYPFEGQYQQSITIEQGGFNNTLSPYMTCPNARIPSKSDRGQWYISRWAEKYLAHAQKRLQKQMHGLELSIEDVYIMQQLCPYETVALGFSKFCELFTEEEWEGFDYALDLQFWYGSAFGSPVARVQGIGYLQEMIARLTHTPIAIHNSSTNSTLDDNPITFPLDHSLYVDATHEVVVLNIITALNLTSFARSGPLPHTHIPHKRSFRVAELAPFATNVQFQLLECTSTPGPQIRVIINDGVAPLTGIEGCPEQKDGMCPLATFVEAQKRTIAETDWNWDCHGDWDVPAGPEWETVIGAPPKRST